MFPHFVATLCKPCFFLAFTDSVKNKMIKKEITLFIFFSDKKNYVAFRIRNDNDLKILK